MRKLFSTAKDATLSFVRERRTTTRHFSSLHRLQLPLFLYQLLLRIIVALPLLQTPSLRPLHPIGCRGGVILLLLHLDSLPFAGSRQRRNATGTRNINTRNAS